MDTLLQVGLFVPVHRRAPCETQNSETFSDTSPVVIRSRPASSVFVPLVHDTREINYRGSKKFQELRSLSPIVGKLVLPCLQPFVSQLLFVVPESISSLNSPSPPPPPHRAQRKRPPPPGRRSG